MKRPDFFEGVGLAAILAVGGGASHLLLASTLSNSSAVHLVLAGSGLVYVLYLLHRSSERVGRIVTVAGWMSFALLIFAVSPSPGFTVAAHTGLIWLVRCLYHHGSALPATADLGLCALACAAGLWAALQTQSLIPGLWCFFLVQALFSALPRSAYGRREEYPATEDRFQVALLCADSAARRLSTTR